ncbi:hypothetical protein [Paraburkholderia caballeronis]|uniref:hypothetical protein n=1 Tax=Paraburkholderia caballeronis TaxID=416943 RepID=UPI001066C5FF|nr:hypothetical protein [Paraburkholderia caballeronis]TDV13914.1 hypothetical protein C7408_10984 [Paraburkholderia caballeronis]TDV15428.1 hypothetical protein C7406_11084 [Paraburkholderia caballeronis]TDV24895.1 hypothetical protein C7404_10984 [Paraburkholderia caballeronis]
MLLDYVERQADAADDAKTSGVRRDDVARTEEAVAAMEDAYHALKARLLAKGASGAMPVAVMEKRLRRYRALRRALQQEAKARVQSLTFVD